VRRAVCRRRRVLLTLAAGSLAALAVTGCGDGDSDSGATEASGSSGGGTLIVLGASSLTEAVTRSGEGFEAATVKPSFAGSDELAAQIRQGAKADVFASADTG
jgi:molybdate transport system substrate-binding protein